MHLFTFSSRAMALGMLSGLLFLPGCGGSGGSTGNGTPTPPPTAALRYTFDPAFLPILTLNGSFGSVFPSGISPKGEWMAFDVGGSTDPAGGYFINGAFTPFPANLIPGATSSETEGAGGNFVWASYGTSTTQPGGGTAILNLLTHKVVTVPNTSLANEAIVSPDGTSALVSITDSTGQNTGTYGMLTAAGKLTVLPFSEPTFIPQGHSNAGWTVGFGEASIPNVKPQALRGKSALAARSILRPFNSDLAQLITPKGVKIVLVGVNPGVNGVNDSGMSVGVDNDTDNTGIATMWDATGKETFLKKLKTGNNEQAFWIGDNGIIVGESVASDDSTSTAVLWQPDGTVIDLGARVKVTGQQAFTSARMAQPNGKITGRGLDSTGNDILAGIIPAK